MESTTKLWKVVVEISHARSDGNGECGRETKTRYFDDFRSAEYFAQYGDIATNKHTTTKIIANTVLFIATSKVNAQAPTNGASSTGYQQTFSDDTFEGYPLDDEIPF